MSRRNFVCDSQFSPRQSRGLFLLMHSYQQNMKTINPAGTRVPAGSALTSHVAGRAIAAGLASSERLS